MNSVENYTIRYLEPKDVKDLDQYNAESEVPDTIKLYAGDL